VTLRQKHWTREPKILKIEKVLKILILVLAGVCTVIIVIIALSLPNTDAWMAGRFLAVPGFFVFPLWVTVSRLTVKGGLFSATYFWIAVFVLFAIVTPTLSIPLSLAFYGLAAATLGYSFAFSRWKNRRIHQGQVRAMKQPQKDPDGEPSSPRP